jgi:class 3 adenylate cyclase/DNA-binding winged helix-turn-helix (wHTH) protein
MLEFRILGPLGVLADDAPVELPRKKQRALLALLVLHAGEAVSTDTLMDELWEGQPPATAKDALQNYVSQLRKALGRDAIVTQAPGYVLEAMPEQIDSARFERLVAEAREDDPEARAGKLREALALWRGSPFADLAYESFTGLEVARLEELRAAAAADLVDAELQVGRHADLVPGLEATIGERPFDERPRGQLMLALYRAGRQADALEAYQHARETLVEELGLEPSAQLRELEQAILRQDPALDAPLAAPVVPEERLKKVTILFADLVESTELAEALDPESLRRVLDGYFAAARRAIEHHGGTIEKFIGDAVMAVFGVPVAHEDDALRAVRAANDLRAGVAALSGSVEREQGLRLDLRIGINTGDVYVGHPGHGGLVTGNAVNIAKRLEQVAPSGSIMLGAATLELVRDAVRARAVKPRASAKEKPPPAFRLLELVAGAPAVARFLEAPLVGRDDELRRLLDAFEKARRELPSQVVTVVGEPGIGKTRLANELVARVGDDALVLTGRCVSYGEGATYLPLREMVESLDLGVALAEAEDAELVARRVLELVGLAEGAAPAGEGAWAVRRLLEALGDTRPLLLLFEDVHWAEPTLLDLVDQLAERATGPIFVVCVARPELLDARPGWSEHALVLEPLADQDSVALLASLPGGEELSDDARERIVAIAAGNPLFAEQLFAYVTERGPEALTAVPPSVEALLESRLDLLDADERALLQRAAVVGAEFSHRELAELSPTELAASISPHLFELVRKGLVRPERGAEETFRFHHVLVRDVAYNGLPRADRARLHERYADWVGDDPGALDEIVGYHLEQAYNYRIEFGPPNRRARQLATDAGARLGAAGVDAWRRSDVTATLGLLERATTLLPETDALRCELLCELGVASFTAGDVPRAQDAVAKALDAATTGRHGRIAQRAQLELAFLRMERDPEGAAAGLLETAARATPVFEAAEDERALGRAWLFVGFVEGGHYCRNLDWEKAAERALVHYRRARWPGATCLGQLSAALYYGPTAAVTAIDRCEALLQDQYAGRSGEAQILRYLAGLVAMRGDFEAGRRLSDRARAIFEELGHSALVAHCANVRGDLELLAGDAATAQRYLGELCQFCLENDEFGFLSTYASDLAEALLELGDDRGAEHWTQVSSTHAASDDLSAQFAWRSVRARVLARQGHLADAEALAREAVALAEPTDALNKKAATLLALAEVLRLSGEAAEAAEATKGAVELYQRKGNVAAVERARLATGSPTT